MKKIVGLLGDSSGFYLGSSIQTTVAFGALELMCVFHDYLIVCVSWLSNFSRLFHGSGHILGINVFFILF